MTADGGGDEDRLHLEQRARVRIDEMLTRAGWEVQDLRRINLRAAQGVAVRELVTDAGPADYVLFVDRQAVGVIEAKKKGTPLSGVEWQTVKYQTNVPDELPAFQVDRSLPFGYESTGGETWFTCRFDPEPTARRVFWFHRPQTLAKWIDQWAQTGEGSLRARIPSIPTLLPTARSGWSLTASGGSRTTNSPPATSSASTSSGCGTTAWKTPTPCRHPA